MIFENLDVWKRAARLSSDVFKYSSKSSEFAFTNQITRSALSVPSNIAEGFERESNKECIQFFSYALGSCGELRSQIYIGIDISYIEKDVGQRWINETIEISSMITGLIKTRKSFIEQDKNKRK